VLLPAVLSLLLLLLPLLASLPMLYCMVFSCLAAQASTSGKSAGSLNAGLAQRLLQQWKHTVTG
jgi:hypothetical protein